MSLYSAIWLAELLRMALVLPQWPVDYADRGSSDFLPLSHFYDTQHLAAFLAARRPWGVNVTGDEALPASLWHTCASQLQMSEVSEDSADACPEPLGLALLQCARKNGVACITSKCSFYAHARLERPLVAALGAQRFRHAIHDYRRAMRPSPLYAAEVQRVLAALARRYGSDDSNASTGAVPAYAAVHARVENDFRGACGRGWFLGAQARERKACFVDEAGIAAALAAAGLPAGSLLLVASGLPLSAFPTLCGGGPAARSTPAAGAFWCWKREVLVPQLGPGLLSKATSVAHLDYLLARQSNRGFGNCYSTFSNELLAGLRAAGRPAGCYNPPLGEQQLAEVRLRLQQQGRQGQQLQGGRAPGMLEPASSLADRRVRRV